MRPRSARRLEAFQRLGIEGYTPFAPNGGIAVRRHAFGDGPRPVVRPLLATCQYPKVAHAIKPLECAWVRPIVLDLPRNLPAAAEAAIGRVVRG